MLYANINAAERARRTAYALTAVGLAGREENNPNQLSGGQQQRVAIARSLVNEPAIILADEPTGNLDSRTSVEVMEIFQKLNSEQGITLVLVTHEDEYCEVCHTRSPVPGRQDPAGPPRRRPAECDGRMKRLPEISDDDDDDDEELETV